MFKKIVPKKFCYESDPPTQHPIGPSMTKILIQLSQKKFIRKVFEVKVRKMLYAVRNHIFCANYCTSN